MRKKTIVLIAIPILIAIIAFVCFLAIPVLYYGDMFLVIALNLKPKSTQIPGRYSASTDWGNATLNIRPDHTFTEEIVSKQFGNDSVTGTWNWDSTDQSRVGISATFKPFIGVLHDKPIRYAYGSETFNSTVIGIIYDEQDPDFGISFYRDKHQASSQESK